jgi:hypothetical protein
MTEGFKCTANPCCGHPSPLPGGVCDEHRWQARLSQMRHSPSVAVRAAAWLATQLHQLGPALEGEEPRRREPTWSAAREAEPG